MLVFIKKRSSVNHAWFHVCCYSLFTGVCETLSPGTVHNLLRSSGYFVYHKVRRSEIPRSAHIMSLFSVWISKQTRLLPYTLSKLVFSVTVT